MGIYHQINIYFQSPISLIIASAGSPPHSSKAAWASSFETPAWDATNSLVNFDIDRFLLLAEKADKKQKEGRAIGRLHGLPLLVKDNIDVLFDDTDEHLSAKFKKFDLIGVPYQIILGSKSTNDEFEFKEVNGKTESLSIENIKNKLLKKRN